MSGNGSDTDDQNEGNDQDEGEIPLEDRPVGTSPEVRQTVASGLTESARQGALAEVFEKYSPEEFNELVDVITSEFRESQKRSQRLKWRILLLSVILVALLFGGLLIFALMSDASGESLIFFAGTLAGYFMRLASEFY